MARTATSSKTQNEFQYPRRGTKRFFIVKAMERGGTKEQIPVIAARIAERAGADFDVKSFKKVDLNYMERWLEERGADVTHEKGGRVRVAV